MDSTQIYASCVAIKSSGILLLGESGAGKSDLALRLIDRGADLVSDDQTLLSREGHTIIANAAKNIAGLLEIRGIGLFKLQMESNVPLRLVVQLTDRKSIDRLPLPVFYECLDIQIPMIKICPFDASSHLKIEMSLAAMHDSSMMVGAFKEA